MSLLRKRRRKSKGNLNPYASRGLEKFALVAAELAEKRQELAVQLGEPLTVVRFTAGSKSTWIPLIVSPTKKMAIETKSTTSVTSERNVSAVENSVSVAAAASLPVSLAEMQPQCATTVSYRSQSAVTNGRNRGLSDVRSGSEEIWREIIARAASMAGTVAGIVLAAKFSTTFGMTIATALASTVLLRRLHADMAVAIDRSLSETPSDERGRIESAANDATAIISYSKRSTEINSDFIAHQSSMASPSSPIVESHLPVPPPPVKIPKALSTESSPRSNDAATLGSPSSTQRTRFKYKFLRNGLHKKQETLSAPTTPREHTAHIAATSSDTAVLHIDKSSQKRELGKWTPLVRERQRNEKATRIGTSLTAVGLVIGLGGLLLGQITAILGVICWWYMLPSLRKAVGDKPFVRSHIHDKLDKHNSTSTAITVASTTSNKSFKGLAATNMIRNPGNIRRR